jgi:hypothetical protein
MTTNKGEVKYRIFTQNCRDKTLTIEIMDKNVFITRTAVQIVTDKELLQGFDIQEMTSIAFIAGMDAVANKMSS